MSTQLALFPHGTGLDLFDALGHLVEARPPGVLPIDYTYDRGRPKRITQGSRTWIISYGSDGFVSEVTDPLGHTQSFVRDGAGRPTLQTLEDGTSAIGYGYDADSNLTSLTTPDGHAHAMSYSPVDLESVYSPPQDGLPEARTFSDYNLDRQPKTETRPDALQLGYGYDSGGRLKTLTIPTGQLLVGYDPKGRVDATSAPSGVALAYGYDGPLPLSWTWQGQVQGALTVDYDPDLRRSSIAPAGGTALNLAYDADSLLTAVGALQLPRDPASGRLASRELGGVTETVGYDSFGDIATVSSSFGAASLYALDVSTRDPLGRISLKVETIDGITHTSSYAYTPRGELRSVLVDGAISTSFTFDADGNRLTRTSSARTVHATYDAQDRLLTDGAESFTYTANGELATRTNSAMAQTTAYRYDVLGNLTHVGLPDGRQIDYLIDGQNRRVGKLVDGVLVQAFIYDGALRPVAEFDGAGNLVQQFVYATQVNVPDYIIRGGALLLVLTDHLGSVRRIVDSASGAVLETVEYDTWGAVISDSQPRLQPFGFAGGLFDPETRLLRFGARDYDGELGRWLAKDQLKLAGGANLYTYAGSDPVNRRDPTGLLPEAMVPDKVIARSQAAVNAITGHDFNKDDLALLTSAFISEVDWGERKLALSIGDAVEIVNAHYAADFHDKSLAGTVREEVVIPVVLTSEQIQFIVDVLERLNNPEKRGSKISGLAVRARELFKMALKSGYCARKPPERPW
jgi:RHS repeat-associated protein